MLAPESERNHATSPHFDQAAARHRDGRDTAASGRQRNARVPAVRGRIVDLDRRVLIAQKGRAAADRPQSTVEGNRRQVVARVPQRPQRLR